MSIKSLCELVFNDFTRKQKSITNIFPTFYDRVKAVNSNGGVRLTDKKPGLWMFSVASGTKANVDYDVAVAFKNIPEMIDKYVMDRRLWKKDGSGLDHHKLAAQIMNNVTLEIDCSCIGDKMWAMEYIRTQRDAQFGDKETRKPRVRNPKQYGILDKHSQAVWDVLPMYTGDFASYLMRFYEDDIKKAEQKSSQQSTFFKRSGEELGARRAEVKKLAEPVKGETA